MNNTQALDIIDDNEFDMDWNSDTGKDFRLFVKELIEKQKNLIDAKKLKDWLYNDPAYTDSINDRTDIRDHIDEMLQNKEFLARREEEKYHKQLRAEKGFFDSKCMGYGKESCLCGICFIWWKIQSYLF